MSWASLVSGIIGLINSIMGAIRSNRDIELGRYKERERHEKANADLVDTIERADPDSVPDDEAFGKR